MIAFNLFRSPRGWTLEIRGRALALAAAVSLPGWIAGCDRTAAPPPPPPPPPEVVVVAASQRDVSIFSEWLGSADGLVNAEVRARVQGYVLSQLYTEGAVVKAGDPLYKIDPRPFEATLAQAQADLSRARANQARTELDVARLTPLAPSGAVSQQELDNAVQDNAANQAAVLAALANVDQAKLHVQYTDVISPINGVAGISKAQVGDLVGGPVGPVLTTISTLDPIRVYFPISEQEYIRFADEINRIESARPADAPPKVDLEMILADGSVYPRKGAVDFANRQVGTTTGSIQIGATFPNPGNTIRPGQYARIRAATKVKKGAVLVPQRCVIEVQGFRQVVVVGADNKVTFLSVVAAERIGSDWVIDEGLKAGERVIVEGLQKVKDGATVTTRLYDPAAQATPAPAAATPATPAAAPQK
ncbi:MAG: efflux RND transporter periplasmic adaptor subunit [Phycisphaerales bacterium]